MPRSARLDIPGLLQHVIIRGIERRDIFHDDGDRYMFLERFSPLLAKTATVCYAWSLLSNHAHFLLMPTAAPLSLLMRRLLTGYAGSFNRKRNRSGHLFQNRYKSIVCEEETYLLELVRYIHLNPLRAGLVSDLAGLDRYPWSGHAVLMGGCGMEGQETSEVLGRFGKTPVQARGNYRRFVADGIPKGRREELVGGGLMRSQGAEIGVGDCESYDERVLGSGSFVESLKEEALLHDKIRSVVSLAELVERVAAVLRLEPGDVRRPSKTRCFAQARGIICYLAIRELGYRGDEVGRELHLGAAGVSVAAARGERVILERPELREEVLSPRIVK